MHTLDFIINEYKKCSMMLLIITSKISVKSHIADGDLIKFNSSLCMEFPILQSHILGKVRPYMIVNEMIYHFQWGLTYMSTPGGAKGMRHPVVV